MKVGALIEDTLWLPGAHYGGAPPALSVLLPTFRRGADGTFLRAATSVLEQSERDLELIIVDDASTEGTADHIDALMRADGRVSCLRHRVNIGLPAISEHEAFLRARAPYVAFAFDDFMFEPDALGRLREAAERRHGAVVHGYIDWYDMSGGVTRLGLHDAVPERLAHENYLGNASFVVPRAVVEHVGFYDPHIAMVRNYDWDLWRRILREYPILREDVFVGFELGLSRPDSLGHTHPPYFEAIKEYSGRSRNTALRPENFAEFDVWEMPPESSACLAEHVLLMRRSFRSQAWAIGLGLMSTEDTRVLLSPHKRCVGVVGHVSATSSLCFDGLPDRYQECLLFIPPTADEAHLQLLLARCDAVIVVRDLLEDWARRITLWCTWTKVPLYYLIDDNYTSMRGENPFFERYTRDRMASVLEDFAGVLCASDSLADYFRTSHLHAQIHTIGPVFDAATLAKARRLAAAGPGPALRVGFVGGDFRLGSFEADVLPALAAVSTDVPVALVSRWPVAEPERWPFQATVIPFSNSFDGFLTTWRPFGIDVLVHPHGHTANLAYKTNSVLLSALYLGAVPIVASDPAFRDLGEAQGVVRADDDQASWERALRRVQAPELRRELLSRLEAFCRSHFSPERNARALESILAASAPTDLLTWAWRIRQTRGSEGDNLIRVQREVEARAADAARLEREARAADAARFEHEARAADAARLEREARAADAARLEHEAQATVVARLEGAARARDARVTQLEGAAGVLEARVAQLEREAQAREARVAWLEWEVGSRAYALLLKIRKVAHVLRRLAFWR